MITPSTWNSTPATPTLSPAVAVTDSVPVRASAKSAGAVSVAVGTCVSPPGFGGGAGAEGGGAGAGSGASEPPPHAASVTIARLCARRARVDALALRMAMLPGVGRGQEHAARPRRRGGK